MQNARNISLKPFNTFRMDVHAPHFRAFTSIKELEEAVNAFPATPVLVLGGGSNILFTKDPQQPVVKNEISGIELLKDDVDGVLVKAGAGENWHRFVLYCLEQNFGGVENLALIPGCVGAAPMQNIGAYGVEMKDVFYQLEAFHLGDHSIVTFKAEDCAFGYRESVFKRKYKNQFVILNVTFKLSRHPVYHVSYGAIRQELDKMNVSQPSIHTIAQAVINIRSSKLPDPAVIGNAGSFFKNPSVPGGVYSLLKRKFPGIIGFPLDDGQVKLAAGWLIEQCGWKGYRRGDAGCHASQALVLVNYGNATGAEIFQLSEEIKASVWEKFGVELEREVNVF